MMSCKTSAFGKRRAFVSTPASSTQTFIKSFESSESSMEKFDAAQHLARSAVREGRKHHARGRDAVLYEVCDAVGYGARLPRPRARDDERRARGRCRHGELLLVQLLPVAREPVGELRPRGLLYHVSLHKPPAL